MPFAIPILIVILIVFIIGSIVGNYFYEMALSTSNKNKWAKKMKPLPNHGDINWLDTVKHDDTWMQTYDSLILHGIRIENKSINKWVIICHGYTTQSETMAPIGKIFYEHGYNVLLIDARGHGRSQGKYRGMGWHDRIDVINWIQYLCDHYKNPSIILYGVSMGGATVMMTSGENLPQNVKTVVEDCGYSSIKKELKYDLKKMFNLPAFPILNFTSMITRIRAGYSLLKEGSSAKQVSKSKVPILFIHGEDDAFVPISMLKEVFKSASCPKDKFTVPGAGHSMSAWVDPENYWTKVFDFIEKYS